MSHPLEHRLAPIRRRVRQVLLLYGLSWVTAIVVGSVFLVGFLDWMLHLDDPGVRLILGVGILLAVLFVAYRFLIRPLLVRIDDVDLAMRVEARYPGFRDSLTSTVQFLQANSDPALGSPALQQRVIERTLAQVENLDLRDVVQTRSVSRVAFTAIAVCLSVGCIVGFNQLEAATAFKRLMFPFVSNPWPRQFELRIVNADLEMLEAGPENPLRIARGDTLELYVINLNGSRRLPRKVTLKFQSKTGEETTETLTPTTLRVGDAGPREVCRANLQARAPVAFRVVGGDDTEMDWHYLDVVPPPVVETLQVTLTPPAYTRRPREKLPRGVAHVEGLIGTQVELVAKLNKPLGQATLRVKDREEHPVDIARDGVHITTGFTIQEPGVYSFWLDLKDRNGFENSDAPRYEVRGIQDVIPDISIDKPATDLQVTADAELPVRLMAKDDLGLREVRLVFRSSQNSGDAPVVTPLFPEVVGETDHETKTVAPLNLTLDYLWNLAPLQLTHGSQVVFHAEGTDAYDLGPEHIGRSIPRTLNIVSREEKSQELADRQTLVLEELERAFKAQENALGQVGELQLQLQKTGALRPEDLDLLQRVELQQRQLERDLRDPTDGLEVRTRSMLEEMQQNHLQDAASEQRLSMIAGELERLGEQNLPVIEQELTQARKQAGTARASDKPDDDSDTPERKSNSTIKEALKRAGDNQTTVRDGLEDLVQNLAQWRDQRAVARDLDELRKGQETLTQETADLGQQTVNKPLQDLRPQEQADLARLAERQQQQGQEMRRLQSKLSEILERISESDPFAAENLRDAMEQAEQTGIVGQMQQAGRQIQENNVGKAGQTQQELLQKLRELDDILRNRGETDTETLVKKLRQAEQELETLEEQQLELLQKQTEAEQLSNAAQREEELQRLKKEQQQLREQTEQMARRLRRLQAGKSSESLGRAAGQMEQAAEDIEQGEEGSADQLQQEALDDLQQARRELAEKRREAEEKLAQEKIAKIADELRAMIPREQNVIDETLRLETARAERGNWTRAQLRSLRDLAEVQRGLRDETQRMVDVLTAAEVFALALKGAADRMDQAAKRLDERDTGLPTQQLEQAALKRFVELIAALKEDPNDKPPENQPPQEGGDGEGEQGPPTDGIPTLAQLKMLKSLQQELNDRTQTLSLKMARNEPLSELEQRELAAIAEEQGLLADLTRNLVQLASKPELDSAPADQPPGGKPEPDDAKPNEKPQSKETLDELLKKSLEAP